MTRRILAGLAVLLLGLPLALVLLYAVVPVPGTTLMLWRFIQGHGVARQAVPIERISPHLARAVIAAEDNAFCAHWGIDLRAVVEVWEEYQAGKGLRGASTITMQVTKNAILWPGRDPLRKALEAVYAPAVDLLWSKRRIMETYLNIAEWGERNDRIVFGAEAAARLHFNKSAANLTEREAALLAAVLPSPLNWSPNPAGDYVAQRAATIQRRIDQLGPLLDCVR